MHWNTQFRVREAMLPSSYFPLQIAKHILFIGKAVCALKNYAFLSTDDVSTVELLPHSDALAFIKSIHKLREQPVFDSLSVGLAVDHMRSVVTQRLWNLVYTALLLCPSSLRPYMQVMSCCTAAGERVLRN